MFLLKRRQQTPQFLNQFQQTKTQPMSADNLLELPSELLVLILSFLDARSLSRIAQVCSTTRQLADDSLLDPIFIALLRERQLSLSNTVKEYINDQAASAAKWQALLNQQMPKRINRRALVQQAGKNINTFEKTIINPNPINSFWYATKNCTAGIREAIHNYRFNPCQLLLLTTCVAAATAIYFQITNPETMCRLAAAHASGNTDVYIAECIKSSDKPTERSIHNKILLYLSAIILVAYLILRPFEQAIATFGRRKHREAKEQEAEQSIKELTASIPSPTNSNKLM